MKRLLPLLLALFLAASLTVPAFAEEDDGNPSPDVSSSDTSIPSSSDDTGTASDGPAADPSGSIEEPPADDTSPGTDTMDTTVSADTTTADDGGVTVNVTIQQGETPTDPAVSENPEIPFEDIPVSVLDTPEDPSAYRTFNVVSPNDDEAVPSPDGSTVMADVVVSILGEYQRKTQTVTEMDSEGNILAVSTEIVPGLAGLDYEWIAGAVFFALFLFSIMKLIGGLIKL